MMQAVDRSSCFSFSWLLLCTLLTATGVRPSSEFAESRPNILFFIVDDLGWGNVGYHRPKMGGKLNPEIQTPNLDEHVANGLELNRHYVHGTCTPTRSSFFSGRLPVHVQTSLAGPEAANSGIPRHMKTFPRLLKNAGYTTHMFGKWDAGFASFDHTPKGRGFDTSLIYTEHGGDYWTYQIDATSAVCGYYPGYENLADLWKHGKYGRRRRSPKEGPACRDIRSKKYEEWTFRDAALEFLDDYADRVEKGREDRPFYVNYASHLMHQPLQIPKWDMMNESFVNDHWMCSYGTQYVHDELSDARKFECRKLYSSMVHLMDKVFGELMAKLKERNLWENTLVVFTSDNGGSTWSIESGSSNFPLRGGKYSDWEGGIRAVSFVSGGYLPERARGKVLQEPIHVSDWYATFSSLGGVSEMGWLAEEEAREHDYPPVDSKNVWDVLVNGANSPHECIHVSLETVICGQHKFTRGEWTNSGWPDGIYPTNFRVMSSSTVYETFQNCSHGCLFDIVGDVEEREDLGYNEDFSSLKQELEQKLAELNPSYWQNQDTHAADSCPKECTCVEKEPYVQSKDVHDFAGDKMCIPCGCWMAKYRWKNTVGPYQDVDNVPTCDVETEEEKKCGSPSLEKPEHDEV